MDEQTVREVRTLLSEHCNSTGRDKFADGPANKEQHDDLEEFIKSRASEKQVILLTRLVVGLLIATVLSGIWNTKLEVDMAVFETKQDAVVIQVAKNEDTWHELELIMAKFK